MNYEGKITKFKHGDEGRKRETAMVKRPSFTCEFDIDEIMQVD